MGQRSPIRLDRFGLRAYGRARATTSMSSVFGAQLLLRRCGMGRCVELADVRRWRMQLRSAFRSRSLGLHPDKTGLSTSDDFIELQEALALIQASHRRLAWRWCAQRTRPRGLQNDEKRALYEQHGHRMQPSTQELSWDKCVWRVSSARRRIRIASAFQVGRGGLGATEGLHTPVVRSQPHEHGGLGSDAVARFGSGWKTADSGVSCQWTSLWSSAHLRSLCAPPDQCAARQRRDLVLSPHVVA